MKLRYRALAPIFAVAVSLLPLSPAMAHTDLVSASPAVDSVIEAWPSDIQLTFNEDLQSLGQSSAMKVTVHNSIAEEVSVGAATVAGSTISVPLKENTVQGLVLASYRVASTDGHVVEGEYTFTFGKTTPGSSAVLVKKKNNTAVYGASTVLIVLTLLFGLWAYRRRRG